MLTLIMGLILFVGIHLFTAVPAARASAVERLGEWPYKGLVALVAVLGVLMASFGYSRAGHYPVWDPIPFGQVLTVALMPVATVLLAGAYMPSNIKRYTAHPMLWGVVVWAFAHLLVRGDRASILLFGGIGGYALAVMAFGALRGDRVGEEHLAPWYDWVTVAVGLLLFAVLLGLHPVLFGVAVVG